MTPHPLPESLSQWLRGLRRRGTRCRLSTEGRLRIVGLRKLTAAERNALFASSEQVRQLLAQRTQRRPKKQEQEPMARTEPQQPRRVIGQIVSPGRPLRLLYEDETKAIDTRRARVLTRTPDGWR